MFSNENIKKKIDSSYAKIMIKIRERMLCYLEKGKKHKLYLIIAMLYELPFLVMDIQDYCLQRRIKNCG